MILDEVINIVFLLRHPNVREQFRSGLANSGDCNRRLGANMPHGDHFLLPQKEEQEGHAPSIAHRRGQHRGPRSPHSEQRGQLEAHDRNDHQRQRLRYDFNPLFILYL